MADTIITNSTGNTSPPSTSSEEQYDPQQLGSYFENQTRYQVAQDEVKKLSLIEKNTQQVLNEKLHKLQQAQMEYDIALLEHKNATKALDDANERVSDIDLLMPGQWNTMYRKLVEYKNVHGHCNVSQDRSLRKRDMHDDDNERKALGRWVGNQRVFYKYYLHGDTKHIKPHRIAALNKIGFVWDVKERKWLDRYDALVQFKRLHGHCRVTLKQNKDLSEWLRRQRYQYQRLLKKETTTMTEERADMLREIGVDMNCEKRHRRF